MSNQQGDEQYAAGPDQQFQGFPGSQGYHQPVYSKSGYPQPGYQQPGYHPAYQQPGFYPAAVQRPTDGLAIASLVLGIVWVSWVGSILAVIFGHISLRRIEREGKAGRGMAIAGLVLGYVGIATLLLFIASIIIGAATSQNGPTG
jgi:hypothetical protein